MVAGYSVPFAWTGFGSKVGRRIGGVVWIKSPRKEGRMVVVLKASFPSEKSLCFFIRIRRNMVWRNQHNQEEQGNKGEHFL